MGHVTNALHFMTEASMCVVCFSFCACVAMILIVMAFSVVEALTAKIVKGILRYTYLREVDKVKA